MTRVRMIALLAFTGLACSAPADNDGNGGGGGNAVADAGNAADDAGNNAEDAGNNAGDAGNTTEDAGSASADAGPSAGLCLNESDAAALEQTYGDPPADVSSLARTCGLACFRQQGMGLTEECVVECMKQSTGDAVTDDCLGCFGVSVRCTVANCAMACAANPTSDGCIACQCGNNAAGENCFEAYTQCSGRASSAACE